MFRRILCTIFACLFIVVGAYADETPEPTAFPNNGEFAITLFEHHLDVILLKSELYEKGYWPATAGQSETDQIDKVTLAAVRNMCNKNPQLQLPSHEYGIYQETWNAILSGQILNLNSTPSPEPTAQPFHHIYWNEQSDAVQALQIYLKDTLNFDFNVTLGLYDEALYEAIDRFLEYNGIEYIQHDMNGITPELQTQIFSNKRVFTTPAPTVTATPAPTQPPSRVESMRSYFLSSVTLFGVSMPQYAVWIGCLVVVIAIILLLVKLISVMRSGGRDPYRNAYTKPRAKLGSGAVEFLIEYHGEQKHYVCDVSKTLRIGRGVGNFPLNINDESLSRKHCEIFYLNHQYMIRDYSSNGTMINGVPLSHSTRVLSNNDVLQIGEHRITIYF